MSIDELLSDKKLYKQIRPTFEFDGSPVKATFQRVVPRKKNKPDLVAYLPASEVGDEASVTVDSIIDRDDCAAAFVCALQSAHLTMFELLGYSYVFSYPGSFLAGVLNDYVQKSSSDKASKIQLAETFHARYMNMVVPMDAVAEQLPFEGTLSDKKLLTVVDGGGKQYATGVVTRFADEFLIVLLPAGKDTRDRYLRMLDKPMEAVSFHLTQIETVSRRIKNVIPTPQLMTIRVR